MKILLIKPNIGKKEHSLYVDEGRMEPLQLGVLAGLTPEEHDVSILDDRCEAIRAEEHNADLVAITVETFTARHAYEIAALFRNRGVPVALGGFHPTLLPDEAQHHADTVVIGDAESIWEELLSDAQAGHLKERYVAARTTPQLNTHPRRELFQGKGYLPVSLMQFSRGCSHGCNFCAISRFFGQRHTCRPVVDVVREIQEQNLKTIFFVDDNITANPAAAKALFRTLIPLRIQWFSQASIEIAHDRELMDLMTESGCLGNVIGFESINPETIRSMNKSPNMVSEGYEDEIATLKKYGLQIWAAFTLGHDTDTPESLYGLYDFALRHRFTFAAYNVLMPYPSTPLYNQLHAENRLLYDGAWWLHPEYRFNHAAFRPANMSAEELTQIAFDIRRKWNHPATLFKRSLDLKTNMKTFRKLAIYWRYNVLFRRETFKKQNMQFGYSKTSWQSEGTLTQ
ncbi:MAG: B12-binding domain-containing radical SAM protein [Pontiellaceae bacterium]|nr:B12-binding domain-containing radical SAM protein [Pontiellaceae bacterium]